MASRFLMASCLIAGLLTLWSSTAMAYSSGTLSQSDAVTTLPAYYEFTKTVTLTNTGRAAALNLKADVVLLAPPSAYAHVTLTGYSKEPNATFADPNNNLIGVYTWPTLKPHQSVTITLHYQATSSDISYHLPKTYGPYNTRSKIYREYTNPKLDPRQIDTDAPAIEDLDKRLVGSLSNPYQRARVLFNWVAYHIRYNYTLKASGSALATLKSRLGICSDFVDLYVSLLRTDHIPAQLIGGYVTNNGAGQGGFHQWVEFYLPNTGWVVADPTWGRYGYFAALQDDWHIPLYDGIRPDISVNWEYAKTSDGAIPNLSIHYHYHFVTEQSPVPTRHVKLPIISVTPPVAQHQAKVFASRVISSDWQRLRTFLRQYFIRLRIALMSL